MSKSKKSSGPKLTIINESNQGRTILLKPSGEGDEIKSVRLRRGASIPIAQSDVSEQLQEMLDNYGTYGLRVIEAEQKSRSSSDDDKDKEDDE